MTDSFVMRGNFCFCTKERRLMTYTDAYCVVTEGISQGIFEEIPKEYENLNVIDNGDKVIIPGMIDLHAHAPQYAFRGLGMELELLQWLYEYTFQEEQRYEDLEYAEKAYRIFTEDLKKSATTRAVIFGTIHTASTLLLMKMLEEAGLCCYVGKVNMDRNVPDYYIESTKESIAGTKEFIKEAELAFKNVKPILTPRFIPTCTDELMKELALLQKETGLPVQSHLSESRSEIQWVKDLCPEAEFYGDAYDRFGLFGNGCRTIMAHCVSSHEKEMERLKANGVYVAHCPNSNMNLSSGIAPVRRFLEKGIHVGLGTDIGAGNSVSLVEEMVSAVQASKMRWRYVEEEDPITMTDAFYMATRGGGSFFGNVGSFEEGFEFDAVVIDDSGARTTMDLDVAARLMRIFYLYKECEMTQKYVRGKVI